MLHLPLLEQAGYSFALLYVAQVCAYDYSDPGWKVLMRTLPETM